jgi:hypothetical protein
MFRTIMYSSFSVFEVTLCSLGVIVSRSHRDQRVYHVQVDIDWGLSYNRDSLCSKS